MAQSQQHGRQGYFLTLEGGEGVGKSTQLSRLAQRFEALGHEVVVSREPGGTIGAEAVRHVLLEAGVGEPFGPKAEALLFAAARNDHIEQVIRPAVSAGKIVIVDRFLDSTRVYQGISGDLPKGFMNALERVCVAGMFPDLTLLLDLAPEDGLRRAAIRRGQTGPADRFEKETLAIHTARRDAFLDLARREPERFRVVDASGDADDVSSAIWAAVRSAPVMTQALTPIGAIGALAQ